jgi:hypothetical protein
MNLRLRHKIAAGAAVAAVLGGGSAAVMAATEGESGHRAADGHAVVSSAARYLGVKPRELRRQLRSGQSLAQVANAAGGRSAAGLIDAIVAARTAKLKAAVAAGKLSPASASARISRLRRRVSERVGAVGLFGGLPAGVHQRSLAVAATYLGVSRARLQRELREGRTLEQIAIGTPGRSATGLIAALVTARTAALDAAVSAGTISARREQRILRHLGDRVAAEVTGSSPTRSSHGR